MNSPRLRALFIGEEFPFPVNVAGSGIRTRLLIDALLKVADVDLLLVNRDQNVEPNDHKIDLSNGLGDARLVKIFYRLHYGQNLRQKLSLKFGKVWNLFSPFGSGITAPVDKRASMWIRSQLDQKKYDFIVCRYARSAIIADLLHGLPTPVILDADDREPNILRAKMKTGNLSFAKKLALRLRLMSAKRVEAVQLKRCAHVWYASKHDVEVLNRDNVSLLPNIPLSDQNTEIQTLSRSGTSSPSIMFVGTYTYAPNFEGLMWFVDQCWPRIVKAIPHATLRIVGKYEHASLHVVEAFQKLKQMPNIQVMGFVPRIKDVYEDSTMTVTPIQWGSGTKIKLLESMAYGRASVVTDHSLEGLNDPEHISQLLPHSSDPETFSRHCIELLTNPAERHRLETQLVEYFQENYSMQTLHDEVASRIHRLLQDKCESIVNHA